jgi:tripartite ATP-independent transporter DctM subunit
MNVGFTMMTVGFLGFAYVVTLPAAIGVLKSTPFSTVSNFNLSVIPLFVLMGQFCFYSGVSTGLYNTCYKWLSRVSGGLSIATLGACGLFSAICGSSPATAATMGTVCLPEMRKYGYKDTLSTGCLAAGGTLGILTPPSVAFILYGVATANSIGALFAAGLVPGIMLIFLYMVTIFIICKIDPAAGSKGEHFSLSEKFRSLTGVVPIAALFGIVVGGIFAGIFTANEGAAIGVVGSFILMILFKKATFENLRDALFGTIKTSAMIFLIIIGAHVFGYFMTITRLTTMIGNSVAALDAPPYAILILILVIFIALGTFMDALAMLLLLVPIFYPVVVNLGIDPILFGVLIVMAMETGQITPPVGINVFVISGVAKDIPLHTIFIGVAPFIIPILVAMALVLTFPSIAVWLPNFLYY